jgi:hypothetical protein
MSASTPRLGLTKPGGGSTGIITPADIVDIDVLNASFDKIDASIGYAIVTSGTRPSSPFNGQQIFETDTKNEMYWSTAGSRWIPVGVPNAASAALRDALYPAPVGGERVYRTDVGFFQRYSASGWQRDTLVRPTAVPLTGTGAAVVINDDGSIKITFGAGGGTALLQGVLATAGYSSDEFELVIDGTTTAPSNLRLRMCVGATPDASAANHDSFGLSRTQAGVDNAMSILNQSSWYVQNSLADIINEYDVRVRIRHAADSTKHTSADVVSIPIITPGTSESFVLARFGHRLTTAFDGIQIGCTQPGTINARVRALA